MIGIDWATLVLGIEAGAGAGVLFFAGLALGMRLALRAQRPVALLILSAALRIAALLALGRLVAQNGPIALAGFAAAFLAVRSAAIAIAGPRKGKEAQGWN